MKKVVVVVLIVFFLGIVGCSNKKNLEVLGYSKAENICIDIFGDSNIVKSYLEEDGGKEVYEIEILGSDSLHSCSIDAVSGKVLEEESDLIVQTNKDYSEALRVAKEDTGGELLLEVEYEDRKFEFTLQNNSYRFEVSVLDNEVISSKQEPIKKR